MSAKSDFNESVEGEGLIVVWRDEELLNALGRMSKDVDRVPVPFDVSADRQLVQLLLAWKVSSEPFRDGVRAMICTSDGRRSTENAHRDRADGERIGRCAAWARGELPRTTPRRLLLADHLEIERASQHQGCDPNSRRTMQIVKLTRERGLGR